MRYFAVSAVLVVCIALSHAQPKIQIMEGTTFDLGTMYRGSVVERNLTVKNTGTDTLILHRVDVSCGCTGTVVSADHIPPGGTGTLLITFNSRNFVGTVHKSVTVNSNGVEGGRTLIEFTATVIDEIALDPQQLFFQEAEVKKTKVVRLTLTNNGAAPLTLTGFRTQMKGLVLKLPAGSIPPGGAAEITAEFTPDAPTPLIADAVVVTTSNGRQPEIRIQVFGNAREFKFE